MKKLMLLTIGVTVLYEVARYYEINSLDDVKKLIRPSFKRLKGLVS